MANWHVFRRKLKHPKETNAALDIMYKFPIDSTEGQDWTQVCEGGRNNRNGSAINLTKPHTKVAIRTKVLLGKLPLYFTSFFFLFLWCPPALFIAIFRNSMILFLHAFSLFCWPFLISLLHCTFFSRPLPVLNSWCLVMGLSSSFATLLCLCCLTFMSASSYKLHTMSLNIFALNHCNLLCWQDVA